MKATFPLLVFAILVSAGVDAQVSVGPVAGLNITVFHQGARPIKDDKLVIDPRAGALFNVPFDVHWHLQPAVIFSSNSYKWESTHEGYKESFHLHVIEVPVYVTYKTQQKNGNHIFFSAGPYLAVNVGGKFEITDYLWGTRKGKIQIGKPVSSWKRFSAGAGVNVGYEFKKGFSTRAYFQKIFTNLNKAEGPTSRLTYYNYGVAFSYQLPLTKRKVPQKE